MQTNGGFLHILTVPLGVTTVPQSGKTVTVKVGGKYQISCNITGDNAHTTNPWQYSNKTEVKNHNETGVTVTIGSLHNLPGICSKIIFASVTEDQLVDYICSAGEGKPHATVTLKEAGKWYVQCECMQSMLLGGDVGYRFLGRYEMLHASAAPSSPRPDSLHGGVL